MEYFSSVKIDVGLI